MAYVLYDEVSPEGARLAFVVPNGIGATPAWSPEGEHLVFPEIVFLPEPASEAGTAVEQPPRFFSHLQRVATADGAQVDLSGDENLLVEDTGPAYSPEGGWIAFSRRSLDPNTWTLGRQIWRMRPGGVDPTQLTDEPELNHGGLAWSPDGTKLAYVLFDQVNPSEPPEVWWRWADGREGGRVMAGGYSPVWIP
jgi:Tol biopolymer transport system component